MATPEMSFWFTRRLGDPNAQGLEEFGGIPTLIQDDVEFRPLVTIIAKRTYWLLDESSRQLVLFSAVSHPRAPILGIRSMKRKSHRSLIALPSSTPVRRSLAASPPAFQRSTPRSPTPSR